MKMMAMQKEKLSFNNKVYDRQIRKKKKKIAYVGHEFIEQRPIKKSK